MRTRFILLYIIWVPLLWSQPLVIQRITVIDATGKSAQPDMTVVIEGDRIASVSPWKKVTVPKDARVIDGMDKFLIPGLWDMHVHGAADERSTWSYPLYLANGVLGVREAERGQCGERQAQQRQAQREDGFFHGVSPGNHSMRGRST